MYVIVQAGASQSFATNDDVWILSRMHFSVVRLRPPYLCCIIELFDSLSVISEQYKLSNVPPTAQFLISLYYIYLLSLIPRVSTIQDLFQFGTLLKSLFLAINRYYYFPGNQILIRFPILPRNPTKNKIEWKIIKFVYRAPKLCMHIACICLIFETFWSFASFLTIFMNDFSNQQDLFFELQICA